MDSGADHPGSVTRRLADELLRRIAQADDVVIRRAATEGLPVVTGAWIAASFANGDQSALTMSDILVDELISADELILVAPVYNFGVPAAMKAWIDQVVRAGRTFRFTEAGPEGLLTLKRAWVVTASGSVPVGSAMDFNTTYLHAILQFLGVREVCVIAAEQVQILGEAAVAKAMASIDAAVANL